MNKGKLNKMIKEDWGSSDQAIMNKTIHKDAGSPKTMPSPFDAKLRSAAEDAVDFWWDEWEEYKSDRDGLVDHAVRGYLRSYFKDQFNLLTKMFEANTLNEGQFSWMTHDTGEQIGSERQNMITVFMYDNKGNKWKESRYDGYGEFGGKDYYELLDQMNGGEGDRQAGIDLAFNDKKVKAEEVLFPALVTSPNYNWKRHDFFKEAESDPNQSWYQEEEYDDDDYDEYDESVVTEGAKFKNTKDFEAFLEEIDGMGDAQIKKIMGKDYIDTPGYYSEEAEDYDNDIIEFMISNMGRKEFEKLQDYWENNVAESKVTESHFKVGDKVKMSHGGEGVIKSLDKKEGGDDEKYYSVELPTGEIHKHSPNELELIESIQERHIMVKRKYTENHPAVKVGKTAKIRNTVIEAVKDGKLTREEFDTILREMTVDSTRWIRRNASYFNVNEDGITLSKVGKKILNELSKSAVVNEKATPYKLANVKAEEIFGEFGVATLDYDQLSRIIDIKMADKLSKKYGEDSFMALTELDMEELLNKNPKLVKENKKQNNNMKNTFIFENFSDFVSSLNESVETVNEAFKSSLLASLFTNKYGKFDNQLAKAFYGASKVKMDIIEDEDLLTMDPATAYKNKQADTIIFYISDNEKENPHAPYDAYYDNKTIPGGGYLLAVASGENVFYTVSWGGRWSSSNRELSLKKVDNNASDSVGISKKYKGWDGTGLYNVKRISEVADRAIVLNMSLLRQKYSAEGERAARAAAKKGATAFKTDKDFKKENMDRYHTILADKAAQLPLDAIVKEAIEKLADQIKKGLAEGKVGKYGDVIIGVKANGSEAKMRDASNHMSNILDDYTRYVSYIKQSEETEARYGQKETYYERESKNYAKSITDKVAQIDKFDYVW